MPQNLEGRKDTEVLEDSPMEDSVPGEKKLLVEVHLNTMELMEPCFSLPSEKKKRLLQVNNMIPCLLAHQ